MTLYDKDGVELTEEEMRRRINDAINYNRVMSLSEMEKELKKVENLRRSMSFEKNFNNLKEKIEKTDVKLKKAGWTAKDLVRAMDNTLSLSEGTGKDSPHKALEVAYREYKILVKYIKKMQETLEDYGKELIDKYKLNTVAN